MTEQLTIPTSDSPAPPSSEAAPVAVEQVQPEPTSEASPDITSTPPVLEATPSASVHPSDELEQKEPGPKKTTKRTKSTEREEAMVDLESQLDELKSTQEKSAKRMSKHEDSMREALLDKLGIRTKFRQYAPKVDPFSEKGRADLEAWAGENPELRDSRPVPTPEFDVSDQVKSFSSPHLVSTENWKDSIKAAKARGGER